MREEEEEEEDEVERTRTRTRRGMSTDPASRKGELFTFTNRKEQEKGGFVTARTPSVRASGPARMSRISRSMIEDAAGEQQKTVV